MWKCQTGITVSSSPSAICTTLWDSPERVLHKPQATSILSPDLLSHHQVPPTPASCPLGNGDIIKPMDAGCTPPQSLMTHCPLLTHRTTSLPCIQTHSYAHTLTYIYIHTETCRFKRVYTNPKGPFQMRFKGWFWKHNDGYMVCVFPCS